jgi:predicted GNAT superfamily acetyltransferase
MSTIRTVRSADLAEILEHNNAAVPAVNELDRPALDWFATHAADFLVVESTVVESTVAESTVAESTVAESTVVEDGPGVAGFLVGLGPGLDYPSLNYRWFSARYDDFVYVDRVVVSAGGRGGGIGTRLYDEFARRGRERGVPVMLAEVNLVPANPGSLRFHDRHGFVPVGEQDTERGRKRVSLLERRLDG